MCIPRCGWAAPDHGGPPGRNRADAGLAHHPAHRSRHGDPLPAHLPGRALPEGKSPRRGIVSGASLSNERVVQVGIEALRHKGTEFTLENCKESHRFAAPFGK